MDNDSQSEPAKNQEGYDQYIDPNYQKKRKKQTILLAVIAGIVALVIIVVVAVFALSLTSNNIDETAEVAETCDDVACFENNFSNCTPTEYTFEEENSKTKYDIIEQGEFGCMTDIEFLESGYLPEAAGKKMTCDLDNTIDLQSAIQNAFEYPDDYDCEGELAELFNDLDTPDES